MSQPSISPGDKVADKYSIVRLIGEGGMGAVFEARHLELGQQVAIKVLLPSAASEMATKRFRREARAAARMRGDHVCRVLDVGQLEGGAPFMVMEYLDGRDLADELAERGRLPVDEAVAHVLQACEALAEAHAAGIVHRDLKPGNLFLSTRVGGQRTIKVLDFGVSKVSDVEQGPGLALTSTAMLVGSPLYMSPEQLESSRDVDGRTDVWALGVVLYELIAGRPPFQADTMPQLVNAVLHTEPPRFSELGLEVPQPLEDAIRHALQKERDDRTASVAELAVALAPFVQEGDRSSAARASQFLAAGVPKPLSDSQDDGLGDSSEAPSFGSAASESRASKTPNGWERSSGGERPPVRRTASLLIAVLVVLLLGAGIWAALPGGEPDVAEVSPAPETEVNAVAPEPPAAAALPRPSQPTPGATEPSVVPDPETAPVPEGRQPQAATLEASELGAGGVTPEPEEGGGAARDGAQDGPGQAARRRPRPRVLTPRARPAAEARPEPAPVPKPAPSSDNLPDFGGRR